MWAQLITVRVKEGTDGEIVRIMELLREVEQPDFGLVRHLVFRDQADPQIIRTLALFESEEKARTRESDPRRQEVQASARAIMAKVVEDSPTFDNLEVIWEFSY